MASDRSPEPPIKLVFLRSEFARSNGGFGFRSIRPTATTSRGRDHQKLAASMHDTRGIDALRCMPLVLPIRHPHLSPAYTTVCVGINGSRFSISCSKKSEEPRLGGHMEATCEAMRANSTRSKNEPAVRHRRARSPRPPPRSARWASPWRNLCTVRRTTPVNRPFGPCVDPTRLALCRPSR